MTHTPVLGIIGGGIRGSLFARSIQENTAAKLGALCDPSPLARANATAAFGVPAFATVDEMIAAVPGLTAAVIATPDFAHRDAAVLCASNGLDLMVEKPLATNTTDARAIVDAAKNAGTRIMVGFENRWNPRFNIVHSLLHEADHGQIVNQIGNLNDTLFVPTMMLSWAAKSSPAWFLMPHSLDLAIWLGGALPVEVHAVGVKKMLPAMGIDTWDAITATFTMSDGSYVVLNSSWVLPTSAPAVYDFRYEIQTTRGAFHIDGANHGVTHYSSDRLTWEQWGVLERGGRISGVPVDMVNDFVELLLGTKSDLPDAADGLLVTQAIEAVHESLEKNRAVTIAS
ncbi:Gfo/Idh/MocA family protein [Arthrobacter sp. A5]|uniref:Gfo/Idh/MocA family protein n=1 Tax=Arthrobacter sp. A5 TaxID=576926 RepID=UPI003DA86208